MDAGFSTLGCPGLAVADVIALAERHRAAIVQLRVADDEPVNVATPRAGRAEVATRFADSATRLDSLATYLKLSDEQDVDGLADHLDLARDLGATALRIFPGDGEPARIAERLTEFARVAHDSGVELRVETHDAYLTGHAVADVLRRAGEPAVVGATWDVLHTWRAGEDVTDAWRALAPYLRELQIKDVASRTDLRPLAPGTGVLPLRDALAIARSGRFAGPVVFEHETKWRADADPFEPSLAAALSLVG